MPRFMSSYAANKRVEDGLRRKQEQIRLDYIRATHRHLDETEKLVADLIHINVRTPSAFETMSPASGGGGGTGSGPHLHGSKSASAHPHFHPVVDGSQQNSDSTKNNSNKPSERQGISSGISPANFRTSLGESKAPGHPLIQVRGNEVFYQYEKQAKNWKKVEPTYKTKLLLHRNNTVIKALSHFNSRNEELSENLSSEECIPPFSEPLRRASFFSRKGSRRVSRISYTHSERKDSAIELPPQLSPGHTPRMLNGWTIMKWCLWNKKQTTPVWATRRYAEMKHREYQTFIANKKRSEGGGGEEEGGAPVAANKPKSAHATTSRQEHQQQLGRESISVDDGKSLVPRAKSVPIGKISAGVVDDDETELTEHFPSIDRGVMRPTTSILRTSTARDSNGHLAAIRGEEPRPKTTPKRRVALDTFVDAFRDDSFGSREREKEDIDVYSSGKHGSKHSGKTVSYDGRSHNLFTWDTLAETDKESFCGDN